jgi:hypothetical protein
MNLDSLLRRAYGYFTLIALCFSANSSEFCCTYNYLKFEKNSIGLILTEFDSSLSTKKLRFDRVAYTPNTKDSSLFHSSLKKKSNTNVGPASLSVDDSIPH